MADAILSNIRILDFSWVLAGPYATRLLADFGAEVIKIQPPLPEGSDRFSQGYFNSWNRNKLGITLNLNQPEGLELVAKLVKISDAVVENFSPRVMENWGLDYSTLQTWKPDIILLSLSAMGHTGPWRDYTGFGPTLQAFSGLTALTSYPGQPPLGLGLAYADHIAALYGSLALLAALEERRMSGRGRHIDLSQMETLTSLLADTLQEYAATGREPRPEGNGSAAASPHGVYRCRGQDSWCAITVFSQKEWQGFKKTLGNPPWAEAREFATTRSRVKNRERLDSLVQGWTRQHSARQVMVRMQKAGVAAGVVQNAADLARDPQLRARQFFRTLPHPELGICLADASPIRLTETAADYRRAAPLKGQDNDYVYAALLGLSRDEIEGLKGKGVI